MTSFPKTAGVLLEREPAACVHQFSGLGPEASVPARGASTSTITGVVAKRRAMQAMR